MRGGQTGGGVGGSDCVVGAGLSGRKEEQSGTVQCSVLRTHMSIAGSVGSPGAAPVPAPQTSICPAPTEQRAVSGPLSAPPAVPANLDRLLGRQRTNRGGPLLGSSCLAVYPLLLNISTLLRRR